MHAAPKPTLRAGRTALHDAAKRNAGEVARALLQAGAHPDARSGDGVTPLHETALSNAVEVARALLDGGADVDAREQEGMTPLHFAGAPAQHQRTSSSSLRAPRAPQQRHGRRTRTTTLALPRRSALTRRIRRARHTQSSTHAPSCVLSPFSTAAPMPGRARPLLLDAPA
jgi:hypothetical protein